MQPNYISKIAHWTTLRRFGNSSVAKLTILIPVIGYVIIFNENLLAYFQASDRVLAGEQIASNQDRVMVSWRLLFSYIGLCLVAASIALYAWYCSWIVKRYESAVEFVRANSPYISNFAIAFIEREYRTKYPSYFAQLKKIRGREKYVVELMTNYFLHLNIEKTYIRLGIVVLFFGGLAVLSVPSINVFWRVLRLTVQTLLTA